MSLFDSASLVVTPNGYKEDKLYSIKPTDGSGDLVVTRATTATRVNSAGLIEQVAYNLFEKSEQFTDAIWVKQLGATVTGDTNLAPNGTLTADTLTVAPSQYLFQFVTLTSGVTYTFSFYCRVASGTKSFNLATYSASGNTFTSPTKTATTDWQRFEMTFTANVNIATSLYPVLVDSFASGNFIIWGAQLVTGTSAKEYFPTTDRLNVPRLDYTNSTCPSILVEPQRTNLVTYSEQFDNAAWGAPANVIANTVVAPDGTTTGDTLTGLLYRLQVFSSITYVFSFYAKKNTQSTFSMRVDAPTNQTFTFNLDTGTADGGCSMVNVGNGWYRCFMPFTSSLTGTGVFYPNVGGNNFYIWGAQLEAGSYATSYIPTIASSVTRNADVISKIGISSLIGQTEGTLFIDFYYNGLANNHMIINDSSFTSYIYINSQIAGQLWGQIQNIGIQFSTIATAGRYKCALAYKSGNSAFYVNGVQVGTSATAFSLSNNIATLDYTISTPKNNINASALWKTRLTNTELASLTTL